MFQLRFPSRARRCSFCRKSEHEVARLLGSPRRVYICDACVAACVRHLEAAPTPPEPAGRERGSPPSAAFALAP